MEICKKKFAKTGSILYNKKTNFFSMANMRLYETPSSISAYQYCKRLPALNKLYPFGGARSVATVIGNVEHSSFQEYYNFFRLDCFKYKSKIFKNEEYHQERLEKVIAYVEQSFKIFYPSFYQHIIDAIILRRRIIKNQFK